MRWRRAGSAAVQAHESASRREAGMTRLGLTGGALVTSVLLASDPVAAQSPSDADKIERLERQVNLLQKQLAPAHLTRHLLFAVIAYRLEICTVSTRSPSATALISTLRAFHPISA